MRRRLLASGKPKTMKDKEEGTFGPHNGWTKYKGEVKEEG